MASTPPPPSPSRLRVPSAPRHGAGYDQYEPYALRSSARLASRREAKSMEKTPDPACPDAPSESRSVNDKTETSSISGSSLGSTDEDEFRRQSEVSFPTSEHSSDTSRFSSRQPSSSSHARTALPTPAKTPSKRKTQWDLSNVSRTLFPTPSKTSSKKPSPFSLESFETSSANKIQIYTDSRDRIPAPGPVKGNPFASQAGAMGPSTPAKRGKGVENPGREIGSFNSQHKYGLRRRHATPGEDETVPNPDEGFNRMFRGKKIFTRFDELDEQDDEEDSDDLGLFASRPDLLAANPGVLQRVKPLDRRSIKPRVLFPQEMKDSLALEEATVPPKDEADTDEEETPGADAQVPPTTANTRTWKPQSAQAAQAPVTTRRLRSDARFAAQFEETLTGTNAADTKRKRISPFDQWQRKKQAIEELSSPVPSAKRDSSDEPMTPPSAKKTRSTRAGAPSTPEA